MKKILKSVNIQLDSSNQSEDYLDLIIIRNRDNSIRWLSPALSKKANFLYFHKASTFMEFLSCSIIRLIFLLGFQRKFFENKKFAVDAGNASSEIIDYTQTNWAISVGSQFCKNGLIVYRSDLQGYLKVASSGSCQRLIENEVNTLKFLKSLALKYLHLPTASNISTNISQYEEIAMDYSQMISLNSIHKNALLEIYNKTSKVMRANQIPAYLESVEKLKDFEGKFSQELPEGIIPKLQKLQKLIDDKKYVVALSHGNFTPWNVQIQGHQISAHNWGLSRPLLPIGFDAINYVIQENLKEGNLYWKQIYQEIKNRIHNQDFVIWSQGSENDMTPYLHIYLFITIINELNLYSKQANWSSQIKYNITVWNAALSDLASSHENGGYQLLSDFLDFTKELNCSHVQFQLQNTSNQKQEMNLSLHVDEDLLPKIKSFISNHILLKKMKIIELENGNSFNITTSDEHLLALHLSWEANYNQLPASPLLKILGKSSHPTFRYPDPNSKLSASKKSSERFSNINSKRLFSFQQN